MRRFAKKVVDIINNDCMAWYQTFITRKQIRRKFLKSYDSIPNEYKQDTIDYWARYGKRIKLYWHKWYSSRNGIRDEKYIPEDLFYSTIEPFYNKVEFNKAYEDKALLGVCFPNVRQPNVICVDMSGQIYDDQFNPITREALFDRCINYKSLVVKPAIESGGGRNIYFIEVDEVEDVKTEINKAIDRFKQNYVIQEIIEQHESLNRINPGTVNTIRVISFFSKGKVHILSSVLRMGVNPTTRVDNQSAGGISCGISQEGRLRKLAFDKYGNPIKKHPQGFVFEKNIVPSYQKLKKIIEREHVKIGHFRLISWDFAIDKFGEPILIEYNLRFQGVNSHQLNNGPLFGNLTNEMLLEVFSERVK